jgi:hypothetical protein
VRISSSFGAFHNMNIWLAIGFSDRSKKKKEALGMGLAEAYGTELAIPRIGK